MLAGAWFLNGYGQKSENGAATTEELNPSNSTSQCYARLAHNRRFLHYANFDVRGDEEPDLETLVEKIDLTTVSSVVSAPSQPNSSTTTLKAAHNSIFTRKITIYGYLPSNSRPTSPKTHTRMVSTAAKTPRKEVTLLTLHPQTDSLAAEWLDGLLILLNYKPITDETEQLTAMVQDYGLKIRLLNVRFDDMALAGDAPEIPSREGLDEDYYYDIFGN